MVGGTAVVALLATTYALAGTPHLGGSDDLSGLNEPEFDATSDVARVAPTIRELREKIGALREPSTESMPAGLRAGLDQGRLKQQFAPDFSRARRLTTTGQTLAVWLIPGDSSLCLVVAGGNGGGGLTCQLAESDASHLSITRRVRDAGLQQQLIGVVPDGVATVTARYSDASSRQLPVANNLYVVRDALGLTGVTY